MTKEINDEMMEKAAGGTPSAFITWDTLNLLGLTVHEEDDTCESFKKNNVFELTKDRDDEGLRSYNHEYNTCYFCFYSACVIDPRTYKRTYCCFLKK